MPVVYEEEMEYEVSDVVVETHQSQVNSQEATDTFFDILTMSEVDTESLVDAQTLQLKQATAENNALKEKITEYQLQLVNQQKTL